MRRLSLTLLTGLIVAGCSSHESASDPTIINDYESQFRLANSRQVARNAATDKVDAAGFDLQSLIPVIDQIVPALSAYGDELDAIDVAHEFRGLHATLLSRVRTTVSHSRELREILERGSTANSPELQRLLPSVNFNQTQIQDDCAAIAKRLGKDRTELLCTRLVERGDPN